jgi:hypothetical protein
VLAGLGIGWYADLSDAVAATVRVIRHHDARPTAVLEDKYREYLELVHALSADATGRGDRRLRHSTRSGEK